MAAVSGTTKNFSGAYVPRLVRVYRKDTGAFVGETVSNPTTGVWSITVPTTSTKYFAVQHDGDASEAWNYLVSGIHFDNGAGIVDVRGRPLSVSGVTLSSSQYLFGGYSGYFDGSSYVSIGGTSTDLDLPGDFTIDIGAYLGDGSMRYLLSSGNGSKDAYLVRAQAGNNVRFDFYSASYGYTTVYGPAPDAGVYNRFRIVRSGNDHRVYTNGTSGSVVNTSSRAINQTTGLYLGRNWYNGTSAFVGYLDDFSLFNGIALSTGSSYTPSGSPFYDPRTEGSENALVYDNLVAV